VKAGLHQSLAAPPRAQRRHHDATPLDRHRAKSSTVGDLHRRGDEHRRRLVHPAHPVAQSARRHLSPLAIDPANDGSSQHRGAADVSQRRAGDLEVIRNHVPLCRIRGRDNRVKSRSERGPRGGRRVGNWLRTILSMRGHRNASIRGNEHGERRAQCSFRSCAGRCSEQQAKGSVQGIAHAFLEESCPVLVVKHLDRAPDRAETGFNPVDRLSLAPRQCRLTLSGIGPGNAAYPARCAFAPQVRMEAPLKPGFFSFMCRGADLVRLCAARDLVEKLL